jgi:hypothetical protein
MLLLFCVVAPTAVSAQLKEAPPPGLQLKQAPPPHIAAPPPAATSGENNPRVKQLADRLPLAPSIKSLRNQMPPDPKGVERQLGLHEPHGVRVNMEGRNPTKQEILHAFGK